MKNAIKLLLILFTYCPILFGAHLIEAKEKLESSNQFIKSFLDKLIQLPETKSEIMNLLDIPSDQEVNRIYNEYIEDYKIEDYDESSLIYSVLVKPRQNLDEVDSDWTTRLQFKLSIVNRDTLLTASIMNRVARSYWKKEEISDNKNPRIDYSKKWFRPTYIHGSSMKTYLMISKSRT